MITVHPSNRAEILEILSETMVVGVHRQALKSFGLPTPVWHEEGAGIVIGSLPDRALLEFLPEDQIAVAGSGLRISELQAALGEGGFCLPLGSGLPDWTLGDALALNLPHGLEAQHGSWRDWVLGMTVMLADGQIAALGTRAVKNVAGYDAHKLFIGGRGVLGIILEVILRVFPIRALQPTQWRAVRREGFYPTLPGGGWIQRTLPSDFARAAEHVAEHLVALDPSSSTLWATLRPDETLPRYRHDWVLRAYSGRANLEIGDAVMRRLIARAKQEFDPAHKLNPGEFPA